MEDTPPAGPGLREIIRGVLETLLWDVQCIGRWFINRARPANVHAARLRRHGFVVIPDFLDRDTCDRLCSSVVDLVSTDTRSGRVNLAGRAYADVRNSFDGEKNYDTGMIDIFHVDEALPDEPIFSEFKRSKIVADIIKQAAGTSPTAKSVNVYVNRDATVPRSLHADSLNQVQFKSFVYLSDVLSDADGPYSFVPRTQRPNIYRYLNLVRNLVRGSPITDMRIAPTWRRVKFVAPKGSLIVTNQRGFHGGEPQKPNHERVLVVANWVGEP